MLPDRAFNASDVWAALGCSGLRLALRRGGALGSRVVDVVVGSADSVDEDETALFACALSGSLFFGAATAVAGATAMDVDVTLAAGCSARVARPIADAFGLGSTATAARPKCHHAAATAASRALPAHSQSLRAGSSLRCPAEIRSPDSPSCGLA